MPKGDWTKYGPVLYESRPAGERAFKDWVLPLGMSLILSPFALKWKEPDITTEQLWVWVGIMFMLVALIFVLLWLRRARTKVQITRSHVVRTRLTGQDAAPRDELTEAVLAQRYAVPGVHSPVLFLTDASTSTRIQLNAPVWSEEEMHTIGQVAPRLTVVPVLSPEEGRIRWPKMMPWSNRHPGVAMAVGGVGTLVLLAVFGALMFWLLA